MRKCWLSPGPGLCRGPGSGVRPAALVSGLVLVIAFTPAGHRAVAGTGAAASCTAGSPELNVAAGGFTCPVKIPDSSGLGEPSIIHDSQGRLFVTAPQAIGNINTAGGSPLFTSVNGGPAWGPPVRSQACTGLAGRGNPPGRGRPPERAPTR